MKHSIIYVAGGQTLLGSALLRTLEERGAHLVGQDAEPDLTDAHAVDAFFARMRPEFVFLTAGKCGGILANQRRPAELMLDNLRVIGNVLDSAHRHGVRKLLYVASACVYPKLCPQPMPESALMTGPMEPTNAAYATAKMAGITLCQAYRQQHGANFIAAIPANLFGLGDDFDPDEAHVIGALMARMHRAKQESRPTFDIWGSGSPRREFVYADDAAEGCLFLMEHYESAEPINLGGGVDLSIRELAEQIKTVAGYDGELRFDTSKPDGMPLKSLDSRCLAALGRLPMTPIDAALNRTYRWFVEQIADRERVLCGVEG